MKNSTRIKSFHNGIDSYLPSFGLNTERYSGSDTWMLKFFKSSMRMLVKCTYKLCGRLFVGVGFLFQLSDKLLTRYLQFLSFDWLVYAYSLCFFYFTSLRGSSYFYEDYMLSPHALNLYKKYCIICKYICFHIFIINLKWIKYIIHSYRMDNFGYWVNYCVSYNDVKSVSRFPFITPGDVLK